MRSLKLDAPHAIVVIGIQGSGKTFFAEKFAETFNAPFLEEAMFTALARDEKTGTSLMDKVLSETLKTKNTIVIESMLSSKAERLALTKQLKKAGYEALFVWVQVDTDTAMARSRRSTGISTSEYTQRMNKFDSPELNEHSLVISGKHTFATQVKAVLRKLTTEAPRPPISKPVRPDQAQRNRVIVR